METIAVEKLRHYTRVFDQPELPYPLRIRAKLFVSSLLLSVALIAVVLFVAQQYGARNFRDHQERRQQLGAQKLVVQLERYYGQRGSWEGLANDREAWRRQIEIALGISPSRGVERGFRPGRPPHRDTSADDPEGGNRQRPRPPPRGDGSERERPGSPPPDREGRPPGSRPPPRGDGLERERPGSPPPEREGRPPGPPGLMEHGGMSLVLFDRDRHVLAGPRQVPATTVMLEINVGGEVVGFVGVLPAPPHEQAIDREFVEAQRDALYWIALAALLLVTGAAFFLSRHLTRPLTRLMEGSDRIARGELDGDIVVESRDEYGLLARKFNHMARSLRRNQQMQREWLGDISHELRTPLAVMRAEIEAMQDGVRSLDDAGLVSLHSEVMQLGNLVEDLYDLAATDVAQMNIQPERLVLSELLDEILGANTSRLERAGISLSRPGPDCAGLEVEGDAQRLAQVFNNLIENSLRYTDSPGELRVTCAAVAGEIEIHFDDTAPGASSTSLPRLFERLYRADRSRSRSTGGRGIGLALCKTIILAHQGEISAAPSELGGLRISLTIPLV